MDLTTRCPQCGTIFSASLEQLQLRKGYIRCINCAHIFDGYDSVVPAGEASAAKSAASVPSASNIRTSTSPASLRMAPRPAHTTTPMPKPPAKAAASPTPVSPPPSPAVMPSVVRQRGTRDHPASFVVSKPTASVRESLAAFTISPGRDAGQVHRHDPVFRIGDAAHVKPDPVIRSGTVRASDPVVRRPDPVVVGAVRNQIPDVITSQPPLYVEPRRPSVSREAATPEFLDDRASRYAGIVKVFWSALIVAGLLLLLAQLAYVYRSQIANQIPALRPALSQACDALGCRVAYSRRIDMISIMSSSLRAAPGTTKDAPDSMTLQLTLRNTFDKPQEWPMLVLDLTDFSGTVVVRKNLPPAAYLPPAVLQKPFAAASEVTVGVPIVLNGLKVNGYQLAKFFP